MKTMSWDDFDAFCRVIEHGGFSAAAQAMAWPKSSVSAAVARLEEELKTRLLERTTRRLRLTEAGEALYRNVAPMFRRLREARTEAMALGDAVHGTLRIAAPYEFGAHHLAAVACDMLDRYPGLEIDIDVEHARIDPFDRHFDIVFTAIDDALPDSSLVARRIFALDRGVFAAPSLLARHPPVTRPQDLADLPFLAGPNEADWAFTAADGAVERVPVAPRMRSSNAEVRRHAAIAGLGLLRVTASYCREALRDGLLQALLPGFTCDPLRIYAVLPGRHLMPAKVRVFLDTLAATARP
ncbi:LysR family transcriptional regulator [Vineibacter terrae]|uniref:LysR family transcriptional regulator n=1 Tax=Vineibacter terrae TaxID=2586908 RepID=UPI002E30C89E|nr:LysR family transcriptional regulator [Vineibacter terrae]HEX2889043.1 LysR family transcriptional regulator [Vineibacter terrae]